MKFLLDECVSHTFAARFAEFGFPDTIHPIHVGMRGWRDDQIAARAIAEDRIVITVNARDYRKLLANAPIHAGAVMIEGADLKVSWQQIVLALVFIQSQPVPVDYMVNRIVEVSASGDVRPYVLFAR